MYHQQQRVSDLSYFAFISNFNSHVINIATPVTSLSPTTTGQPSSTGSGPTTTGATGTSVPPPSTTRLPTGSSTTLISKC